MQFGKKHPSRPRGPGTAWGALQFGPKRCPSRMWDGEGIGKLKSWQGRILESTDVRRQGNPAPGTTSRPWESVKLRLEKVVV